ICWLHLSKEIKLLENNMTATPNGFKCVTAQDVIEDHSLVNNYVDKLDTFMSMLFANKFSHVSIIVSCQNIFIQIRLDRLDYIRLFRLDRLDYIRLFRW
ncbi:hypothetical protein L9F63_005197, partial [Diploptera punctata]